MTMSDSMECSIIITYRCNAKCQMCHTWMNPTHKGNEFHPKLIEKLPSGMRFINLTGGEPFLREDIYDIINIILSKTKRLVISTNGFFTEKIVQLANHYGNKIGIRVSLEGLPANNDRLRGLKHGFDHGLRTLLLLDSIGLKDIGFAITLSDYNINDLLSLYHLSEKMKMEFATAVTHNSFYFHKSDNMFNNIKGISSELSNLSRIMLASNRPKNWFRAYFNMGLANKVKGERRPLTCKMGTDSFFLDPFGNILPCNGSDEPMIMGNLHENNFNNIWNGKNASLIRNKVKSCQKQCWMTGSAVPAMKKKIWIPSYWIIKNKLRLVMRGKKHFHIDDVL